LVPSTVVQFTPKLLEEVSDEEKDFLGVDFERLRLESIMPYNVEDSE